MENKRRKISIGVVLCMAVLVIAGVLLYVLKNNTLLMATNVEAYKWYKDDTDVIVRGNVKEMIADDVYLITTFYSKSEREDMVATNLKDYLGEIIYYDENLSFPASLFYTDNSYYVYI